MRQNTLIALETLKISDRKSLGQFFTPDNIRHATIAALPDCYFNSILEPSFGTGEFIYDLAEKYPHAQIDGYEIDPNLHKTVSSNGKLICGDFLFNGMADESYDLVIGNPPYFQVRADTVDVKFNSVICGRPNIFSLFVYEGIRLLKQGGWLSFVVPTSICGGAYFNPVRDYVSRHCGVKSIIKFEEKEFQDAQQSVVILTLEKGGKHTDGLVINRNGHILFNHYNDNMLKDTVGKSLKDYGFVVKTGNIVWNQWKYCLSNEPRTDSLRLFWSYNISELGIIPITNKPTYIFGKARDIEPFRAPAVIVNRILGTVGTGKIRCGMVPRCLFYAENHVNVIFHESYDRLCQLIRELRKPESSELARRITGNTQLSKTELQNILPINLEA